MSKEIAEDYASSLSDLTVNSKPLINMLTILAEENVDHAGVIVDTVEKHLEKVHADIKLPVLYLVDSIIKNVGGAYVQKFSQIIVNMFTKTFKQVDEKVRSQMFKLRETWHDVFPATKLYQLDVKVNLIDPAWPIQAQPHQSNIHPAAATSTTPAAPSAEDEEKMKLILAKKEQELLMLQRKKIEIELEKTRRALEIAAATNTKMPAIPSVMPVASMPVALVNPVPAPAPAPAPDAAPVSVKQRLGPPVNKAPSGARIAPVSGALASARRDPRLARRSHQPQAPPQPAPVPQATPVTQVAPIAPNVFDIKPLERVTKRKNVITIDVRPDAARQDPRLDKRDKHQLRREAREAREARREEELRRRLKNENKPVEEEKPIKYTEVDIEKLQIADAKKISKLPPIPKLKRDGKREEAKRFVEKKKKKRDTASEKESSGSSSPEKKARIKKEKPKERPEPEEPASEVVAFKELRNYHPERYMRRNRARSPSAEPTPPVVPETRADSTNQEVVESKDVDLRVLPPAAELKPAPVAQKRSSTEMLEGKAKKNKIDKFDILFGNEDVDLRQLPQVEEIAVSPKPDPVVAEKAPSPLVSPKKDWHEVKEREEKKPSKLDLVRAKLAEATKGKDRLGRPFLFSKSPSVEKERRRTISSNTEDVDLRVENPEEFDAEDHKKTISIIMDQAKEQFTDGKLDKNQYNTLMYQVLQLNEKLKLKEAKQRESLEISKRKLKAHTEEANHKVPSPKTSPTGNNFGDIDERVMPGPFPEADAPPELNFVQDSDMRMMDGPPSKTLLPRPPVMPMFVGPQPPAWANRFRPPRMDEFPGRRPRGIVPPFFRGKFDKRSSRFDPRMSFPALPTPQMGICQGECPLPPYERAGTPPPLGAPGINIPPTFMPALEYIDQDPVKTIQIDGIPREIRFYGETAVIMLDWDDPREIKFLPGSRRVTFDNKDSIVLNFNEDYKQVEIDDQVFNIRFGAPTRELFINGRWHECFFGGAPLGVIIDGKPRLIHLEGPLPQVDIGKLKRTDLVGGKINLIVDATQMCPVFLDAKVQKFNINGQFFTIRFVDAFRTVLINEQPFQVEFGGLPRPVFIGNEKHFIRFSVLPRHVRPGHAAPPGMQGEGRAEPAPPGPVGKMEVDPEPPMMNKTPSPQHEMTNQGGLDMLASLMPSSMAPASASDYSSAEPTFTRPPNIPGLETPSPATTEQKPAFPALGNIEDLFAKLVATGIIQSQPQDVKEVREEPRVEEKTKPVPVDRSVIHRVDLTRPETLRVKQPGLVAKLYGGMQCSGCGARFPPEHTVRYSQHLDWHFRQNRRERDSARRAHSRHWHYDLADWVQYEELEDLEEREKSWFETGGSEVAEVEVAESEAPSVAAGAPARAECALCGDAFQQFYNEDKEEWHLRNSVRHDEKNYHPLCLDDYKVTGGSEVAEVEVAESEAPSVAAGAPARAECALCGDAFQQFYNEDKEEWHLRNSVRHDEKNYHPLCLDDYKVTGGSEVAEVEVAESEAPSVAAGAPARAECALCGDAFQQFYNEDKEEWHLRNSVRHDEKNYHPLCLDDYKVTGGSEVAEVEVAESEAPSVAAGAPARAECALCGDAFQQFYNEDKEEWHLRNSVRHDEKNYHPLCLDDYKVTGGSEVAEVEVAESEAPSVAAGAPARAECALCGDAFQQFYNEDKEEWHLRNSVRHDEKNYHPLCLDDYKVTGGSEVAEVEVAESEAPSVAAGAPARAECALCGDAFQQFYNEDKEEWHLRNSVRHDEKNYHPLCLDDYKVTGGSEVAEVEVAESEAPSVAAGAPARAECALCGDAFQQFYNEDKEEWHLRNSVRHDEKNYHPLCLDDYKVTGGSEVAEVEVAESEAPSVAAGAPARAECALCGDAFQQFYNEDKEEWHLRNSVRHDEKNYHPLCLDDYKASLMKEEPPKEEVPEEKVEEEAIEIKDGDDALEQSDTESVVEVIDNDKPVEIDDIEDEPTPAEPAANVEVEGDEDDVVFKPEPVPEVLVDDDADTDDETSAARNERDEKARIEFENVRVKQEPVDPDDEPIITAEEEAILAAPDTSRPTVLSAIDGNAEPLAAAAAPPPPRAIRINICKPAAPAPAIPAVPALPAPPPPRYRHELEDVSGDDEPPPPGEEPELEYTLKPALEGVGLSRQPPVQKGNELSGLCSIM